MYRRKGLSLVEMVAAMILVSALSSMLVVLTRRAVQSYSHTIDRLFTEQASQRWMEQLRIDIHQSREATLGENGTSLLLKLSDQESIEYAKATDRTIRLRTIDGRILSTERSPWPNAFFSRVEMPNGVLIDAKVAAESKVSARLGVEQP